MQEQEEGEGEEEMERERKRWRERWRGGGRLLAFIQRYYKLSECSCCYCFRLVQFNYLDDVCLDLQQKHIFVKDTLLDIIVQLDTISTNLTENDKIEYAKAMLFKSEYPNNHYKEKLGAVVEQKRNKIKRILEIYITDKSRNFQGIQKASNELKSRAKRDKRFKEKLDIAERDPKTAETSVELIEHISSFLEDCDKENIAMPIILITGKIMEIEESVMLEFPSTKERVNGEVLLDSYLPQFKQVNNEGVWMVYLCVPSRRGWFHGILNNILGWFLGIFNGPGLLGYTNSPLPDVDTAENIDLNKGANAVADELCRRSDEDED